MARKPQQRAVETRARLLQAVETLAEQNGLDRLTAEAIATAAGVAKGTLFAHFGDMDGLLSHVLLRQLDALLEAPTDPRPDPLPTDQPLTLLFLKLTRLIEVITESQTSLRLFLKGTGYGGDGTCAPDFIATLGALDQELCDFLRRWQQTPTWTPSLRTTLTPEEMTDGLIAFTVHASLKYRSGEVSELPQVLDRLRVHVHAYLLA